MSKPDPQADAKRAERVLDRLLEESDAGELSWETGAAADSYAADVRGLRLRVRSRDGDGARPYVFELWDSENNLTLETERTASGPDLDQKILELYERGKDAALNPYKALDSIERQLGLASD